MAQGKGGMGWDWGLRGSEVERVKKRAVKSKRSHIETQNERQRLVGGVVVVVVVGCRPEGSLQGWLVGLGKGLGAMGGERLRGERRMVNF